MATIKNLIKSIETTNLTLSIELPDYGTYTTKQPKSIKNELVTVIKISHGGGMGGANYELIAITNSITENNNFISFTDFNTNELVTINNNFIVSKIDKKLHFIEFYTEGYQGAKIVPSKYALYVLPLNTVFKNINWVSYNSNSNNKYKLKSFSASQINENV